LNDLENETEKVLAGKCMLQGAKFVKDAAKRPDIARVIVGLGLAHFR